MTVNDAIYIVRMTDKTKNLTVNISFPNMILSVIFALS